MTFYKQGLAFGYVQGTKYCRDRTMKDNLGSIPATQRFKSYPEVERLQLPEPDLSRPANLLAMPGQTSIRTGLHN